MMDPLPSISIVGTGNVAEIIGQRLHDSGIEIISVVGRNVRRVNELCQRWNASEDSFDKIRGEFILVALPDSITPSIIDSIDPKKIVVFTAGSISLQEIDHPNCGVFYPLQSFSKERKATNIEFPLLIEAKSDQILQTILNLGKRICTRVEICNSEKRKLIHLSAVFINNFSNHMIYIGQDIAKKNSIDPLIFSALIKETMGKLEQFTAFEAQTGPALRKDKNTIQKHLNLLKVAEKKIYLEITNNIIKTYHHD